MPNTISQKTPMQLRNREKEIKQVNKQKNLPRNANRIIEIDKTFLNNLILGQFRNEIIALD